MVDREARDCAAEIVRHFITGQSFNYDFQDSEPVTKDPVIPAIWESLWPFYCDLQKHKMIDDWSIPSEGKSKIAIWLLFLYSDLEYSWPLISFPGVRPQKYSLFSKCFGLHRKQERFLASGVYELWPFSDHETFNKAKRSPKLLIQGNPIRKL